MTFDELCRGLTGEPRLRGLDLVLLATVDSTNAALKRWAAAEAAPSPRLRALVAWRQTAGRGRAGRSWHSPPGAGLYASIAARLEHAAALAGLPLAVAAALCGELDRGLDGACRLKWPNDLLVGGRKLGGVLIEAVSAGEGGALAVVGFGINHAADAGLPSGATSICGEARAPAPLDRLAAALLAAAARCLERPPSAEEAAREFAAWCVHRSGDLLTCRTSRGSLSGVFRGLDDSGRLRLDCDGRIVLLDSAEVAAP